MKMEVATQDSVSSKTSTVEKMEDREISKYFLFRFFKALPESENEKSIADLQFLKIILCFFDKCCELLDKECGNSKTLQLVKERFQWKRGLSNTCSVEDVTYASENLLLEYEIVVHDDGLDEKRDAPSTEKMDSEKPSKIGQAENLTTQNHFVSIPKEGCVEKLIGLYFHAGKIEQHLRIRINGLRNGKSNSTEDTDSMETDDEKKDSTLDKNAADTDRVEERLPNRLEFIRNLKLLIRASLILFKRLNSKWVESGEKYLEQVIKKRKEFFSGKRITIQTASSENTISSNLDTMEESSSGTIINDQSPISKSISTVTASPENTISSNLVESSNITEQYDQSPISKSISTETASSENTISSNMDTTEESSNDTIPYDPSPISKSISTETASPENTISSNLDTIEESSSDTIHYDQSPISKSISTETASPENKISSNMDTTEESSSGTDVYDQLSMDVDS